MRVLAASDLHGSHPAYEWLAKTARQKSVSLVILAGDLLGCPDGYDTVETAQRADAVAVIRILEALRLRSTSSWETMISWISTLGQISFSPCMDDVLNSAI